jgi:hypothetical protein
MEHNLVSYYEMLPKEIWDIILYFLKVGDIVKFFSVKKNISDQPSEQWWKKYREINLSEIYVACRSHLTPWLLNQNITNEFVRVLVYLEDAKLIDVLTTSRTGIPIKRITRGLSPNESMSTYLRNDRCCLVGKNIVIHSEFGEIRVRNLVTGERYNLAIKFETKIKDIVVDGQPLIEHINQHIVQN